MEKAVYDGVLPPVGKKPTCTSKSFSYDAEMQTKIAWHALMHGKKSACEVFSKELGHPVNEATVRKFK